MAADGANQLCIEIDCLKWIYQGITEGCINTRNLYIFYLSRLGFSQGHIARHLQLSKSSVGNVIRGAASDEREYRSQRDA